MAWAVFRGRKGYHIDNGRVLLDGTYSEMIFETPPMKTGTRICSLKDVVVRQDGSTSGLPR
jgi:hypothetical protein